MQFPSRGDAHSLTWEAVGLHLGASFLLCAGIHPPLCWDPPPLALHPPLRRDPAPCPPLRNILTAGNVRLCYVCAGVEGQGPLHVVARKGD